MPEELALEELARNGCAIDFDQDSTDAAAAIMESPAASASAGGCR
jgi:hypothetical protein